ncbi:MAG: hypothetical protein HYV09_32810 [Deltaproteobacteria bacterium]|nr:hypothetical protein [Deltaproteobacteria bacterium]
MDCERLDELAIDLVDPEGAGEIDARARREADEHLVGCARCAALVERLRQGMRAADELPFEDPSSLLEARVLAAASAARPAAPMPRRIARAISTAGRWAMRPQVAMAAVLVVMVGTSVLLLRGGGLPSRQTKVTEEGTPVATLEPAAPAAEQTGAPAVIGGEKKAEDKPRDPAKAPAATPAEDLPAVKNTEKNTEKNTDPAEGAKAKAKAADDLDGVSALGKAAEKENQAPAQTPKAEVDETVAGGLLEGKKGGGGAPPKPAAPPPPAAAAPASPGDFGAGVGATGGDSNTKSDKKVAAGPTPAPTSAPAGTASPANQSTYDEAMTAYKEARYPAAAKGFDAAAAAGVKPSSSLLYAARSYRAAGSCVQALPRFQRVIGSFATSLEAPWAALEGGQCAKAMGDVATARTLFEKAKTYPATKKQAEAELAALSAPPPAKAKAAKPPSAVDSY